MEGFQGIVTWDLKHRFARDLNLLMFLTALILEGRELKAGAPLIRKMR